MMVKWMALLMLDDWGYCMYEIIINAFPIPYPPCPLSTIFVEKKMTAHPLEHSINTCLLIELTQGTFLS